MSVQPWEPVTGWFFSRHKNPLEADNGRSWAFGRDFRRIMDSGTMRNGGSCLITLANGQRIIVRALSDERKAARASMKGSSHVVA